MHQTQHPELSTSFSKSHFGPQLAQKVIDYGGFAPASEALERVRRAGESCERYVQSTSPIGANSYLVRPLEAPRGAGPGTYLRLEAVGRDFQGIHWDLWVHDCDKLLTAVSFRSARGGDNADLWPAIDAVMQKLHPA